MEDSEVLNIIIVNYAMTEECDKCINSILDQNICPPEDIILVDNKSPDNSGELLAKRFPRINTLITGRNPGYGGGVNRGAQAAKDADFYLILNPDTYFEDNNIAEAIKAFENNPELGVLGLNLYYPDGRLQYSARMFYSVFSIILRRTPMRKYFPFRQINDNHLMKSSWSDGCFDADWVIGTGFIVRAKAFQEIGGMDEGYFMYMEDVDLCARMWLNGWRVQAIPGVHLIHQHLRASSKGLLNKHHRYHLASLMRFFRKFGLPLFASPTLAQLAERHNRYTARREFEN